MGYDPSELQYYVSQLNLPVTEEGGNLVDLDEIQRELDFFANTEFNFEDTFTPMLGDSPACVDPKSAISTAFGNDSNAINSKVAAEKEALASGQVALAKPEHALPLNKTPSFETDDQRRRRLAEEDRRRRNTAASARFRVKKKLREQTLERTAKELNEKVAAMEAQIKELKTENNWLKSLIVQRKADVVVENA